MSNSEDWSESGEGQRPDRDYLADELSREIEEQAPVDDGCQRRASLPAPSGNWLVRSVGISEYHRGYREIADQGFQTTLFAWIGGALLVMSWLIGPPDLTIFQPPLEPLILFLGLVQLGFLGIGLLLAASLTLPRVHIVFSVGAALCIFAVATLVSSAHDWICLGGVFACAAGWVADGRYLEQQAEDFDGTLPKSYPPFWCGAYRTVESWQKRVGFFVNLAAVAYASHACFVEKVQDPIFDNFSFGPIFRMFGVVFVVLVVGLLFRRHGGSKWHKRGSEWAQSLNQDHSPEDGARQPYFALFLRGFRTDRKLPAAAPPASEHVEQGSEYDDWQVLLTRALYPDLPLVGVGRSDEKGALNVAVEDADWMDSVRRLVEKATLVIVIPASSEGAVWEMALLKDSGSLAKTVWIRPSTIVQGSSNKNVIESHWCDAASRASELGLNFPPTPSPVEDALLFQLNEEGEIHKSTVVDTRADDRDGSIREAFEVFTLLPFATTPDAEHGTDEDST